MNALIFHCEAIGCPINPVLDFGIEFCSEWRDFKPLGIAVISVWDYKDDRGIVFTEGYFHKFQELIKQRDYLIGFNSVAFGDKLLNAHGIKIFSTYDLLCEVRIASGQPPTYFKALSREGYDLESLILSNLPGIKPGISNLTSVLWQFGHKDKAIRQCCRTVELIKLLIELHDNLIDPVDGSLLQLRNPFERVEDITDDEVAIALAQRAWELS